MNWGRSYRKSAGSVILLSTGVVLPPSSSGLGHHPFKVAARVRIPLGVPRPRGQTRGPVVKLEFTPACQAGGRGFESRRDRQVGGCRVICVACCDSYDIASSSTVE